ncbi:MAG: chemotaxis protein CheW, partial [Ruminiclostridium sp.]
LFNNIALMAHAMEDLFYFIREEKPQSYDCSFLSDLILEGVDFIKLELEKIKCGDRPDGNATTLIEDIKNFLSELKNAISDTAAAKVNEQLPDEQHYIPHDNNLVHNLEKFYKAVVYFEEGCEMENIRAYTVIHNLKDISNEMYYTPENIIEDEETSQIIRKQGFTILFKADKNYDEMQDFFMQTLFLRNLELTQFDDDKQFLELNMSKENTAVAASIKIPELRERKAREKGEKEIQSSSSQGIISVSITKLNKLMDLVGEMVVAEAMVTQNPDLRGLELDNFQKAARQLRKISSELQDTVMSIRMVPISSTFHKMHRIVRDMSKKLDKEVSLEIIGEETEVDKNIIEHISDPLMHLVRNSIDHGMEPPEDRAASGKPKAGTITLEARNAGSDVLIIVKDDGKGLNKEKILKRAEENGLLHKAQNEMTDKEIYSLIFLPGFSTNEDITEFSGRGVGMDVVVRNLEAVGGMVWVESTLEVGTTITMKIPLTLAIIDGMNIRVGSSRYTIPTTAIRESFRPKETDIIRDPDENEMLMVRGMCYPILRLHEVYKVKSDIINIDEGIIIMVENGEETLCIFADELLGEQQVVVKVLPKYIKKIRGMAGCTILGDGNISLIIDVAGFKS